MGTKKKKTEKSKRPSHGHYCKVCGEHKANEKFSGKGHAAHICKACASKSPAQKSEDMTINRLNGMAFRYLSEAEIKWLKNRRNDSRPEVQELARQVFDMKFPRQARNEIKAKLHMKNFTFRICGEMYDCYGDEYMENSELIADTTGKIIKKTFDDNGACVEEKSVDIGVKAIRKLFNVAVHNYDISFWEIDLCREISYDPDIDLIPDLFDDDSDFADLDSDEFEDDSEMEQSDDGGAVPDDRIPTWRVDIKYKNGTEQATKGYDYIPDSVMELYDEFNCYFDDEFSDDEFDEDEDYESHTEEL